MKRNRLLQLAVVSVALTIACCAAAVVVLFIPASSPTTAGLPPWTTAQACVGTTALPHFQVGASLDACWICSSLNPWMQGWTAKACATIPWPVNGWSLTVRWGFEFPP